MRAWIDRTNDGLSRMPADGISLPQTKGNFGTSRWAARRLGYTKSDIGRKGETRTDIGIFLGLAKVLALLSVLQLVLTQSTIGSAQVWPVQG